MSETIKLRYYNCNGYACAIVAVVNPSIDWAAYVCGHAGDTLEDETVAFVAEHGAKLSEADARHYMASELPYRR